MNYLFIIVPAILIGIVLLYIALEGAIHVEQEEDPFVMQEDPKVVEPEKVTDHSKEKFPVEEKDALPPKKKKTYYKKRPKRSE